MNMKMHIYFERNDLGEAIAEVLMLHKALYITTDFTLMQEGNSVMSCYSSKTFVDNLKRICYQHDNNEIIITIV